MMRQTAAFHLNPDFGGVNMLRWRVLNAAALPHRDLRQFPPVCQDTGNASNRALAWRELDPARTGILPVGPVAEDEYLDFALRRSGHAARHDGRRVRPSASTGPG